MSRVKCSLSCKDGSHHSHILTVYNRRKNLISNQLAGRFIVDTINKTVNKFRNNIRSFDPSKCPVYVRLLWIGSPSQLIADKVKL